MLVDAALLELCRHACIALYLGFCPCHVWPKKKCMVEDLGLKVKIFGCFLFYGLFCDCIQLELGFRIQGLMDSAKSLEFGAVTD